ncbi:MAG: response regulator [Bacteroidota bacterium]
MKDDVAFCGMISIGRTITISNLQTSFMVINSSTCLTYGTMQALRIMIVEDEPVISEEIAATIEDLSYITAAKVMHAKDVLNIFRISLPDLGLMDINLGPGKDGIQLAAELMAEKMCR